MTQPIIDPFKNINFTESLKESIKQDAGVIYSILKEIDEANRRCKMSVDDLLKEPDYDIKLTEIQTDPDYGVICRIVYNGKEYF